MSTAKQHPFQSWLEDKGVLDVRFYPLNPSESTATSLLDSAHNAVRAYEENNYVPYEDNTKDDVFVDCSQYAL